MKVLREFIELGELNTLEEAINLVERDLATVMQKHGDKAVTQFPMGTATLDQRLEELERRMMAARKGLALANSLTKKEFMAGKNPEEAQAAKANANKQKGRVMSNLSVIGQVLKSITQELERQQGRMDDLRQATVDNGEHGKVTGLDDVKKQVSQGQFDADQANMKPEFNKAVASARKKPSFLGRMADKFRSK
jgi:hypothetical protein